MTLEESTNLFIQERTSYYKKWLFDEPLLLPTGEAQRFVRLQTLLHKVIVQFVRYYDRYAHLMPVGPKVREIIEVFSQHNYTPGTYRTDFIENATGQIKIIEITCRFALNGYFFSGVFNQYARAWIEQYQPHVSIENRFTAIFGRFEKLFASGRSAVVLQGADRRNESKLFSDILQRAGISVSVISPQQIQTHETLLFNSVVINELSFDELTNLPRSDWERLARAKVLNDLRTVFLIHDKRFFGVMQQDELLRDALTATEQQEFRSYCVKTLTDQTPAEQWAAAIADKGQWVLKPSNLGKSIDVHVGRTLNDQEWRGYLATRPRQEWVLQEWIDRPLHHGTVNGVPHADYAVGSALFWDEDFYGLTEYRTSSHPVTNKVDHRKLSSAFLCS